MPLIPGESVFCGQPVGSRLGEAKLGLGFAGVVVEVVSRQPQKIAVDGEGRDSREEIDRERQAAKEPCWGNKPGWAPADDLGCDRQQASEGQVLAAEDVALAGSASLDGRQMTLHHVVNVNRVQAAGRAERKPAPGDSQQDAAVGAVHIACPEDTLRQVVGEAGPVPEFDYESLVARVEERMQTPRPTEAVGFIELPVVAPGPAAMK